MADVIGLRVRDKVTGMVTLEITDRITRVIGKVDTGTAPGSITVPQFEDNDAWVVRSELVPDIVNTAKRPIPVISGTTLSWSFPTGYGSAMSATLIYGIY